MLEEEVVDDEEISESVEEGIGKSIADETPAMEGEDEIESRIKSILSKVEENEKKMEEFKEESKEKEIVVEKKEEKNEETKQTPLVEEKLIPPSIEKKVAFEPFKIPKTPEIKNL